MTTTHAYKAVEKDGEVQVVSVAVSNNEDPRYVCLMWTEKAFDWRTRLLRSEVDFTEAAARERLRRTLRKELVGLEERRGHVLQALSQVEHLDDGKEALP